MRKVLYLLPFAALAMASCSNSDDVIVSSPVQNAEVKIFPQVTGSTRGTIETTASISEFKVITNGKFGTAASDDPSTLTIQEYSMDVTKSAGSWTMATPLYWGDATTAASFTAFAPKDATYSAGKLTNFTVDENDPAAHKDLIVAYNNGTKTDFTSGVPLHFQHALAQVIVNANYTFDSSIATNYPDVTVKVKGIKFVNADKTGTLTLPTSSTVSGYTAAWTLSGTNTAKFESVPTAAQTLSSTNALIDNSAAAGPMLLLPQTQAATTDLSATTVTGAYLIAQVDIDYKEAQNVDYDGDGNTDTYKCIDLYPKPQTTPTADQTAGEGTYDWIAVPVNIDWKAGYKYTYTLNFSNAAFGKIAPESTTEPGNVDEPIVPEQLKPVTFLVTVESDWTEQNINSSF